MSAAAGLAIGSLISSMFSGIANWFATNRTNQQNQANYEDWKNYNTPVNQMSRLQEAGLNPYMVNGMSNTLSEPFNVQNNTGISQMFSNMSQAMAQGASNINTAQANRIKNDQLKLNQLNSEVRRRLTEVNIKNGNYYGALLMSQGSIAEINKAVAQELFQDTIDRYRTQNKLMREELNYAMGINPMKLEFYKGYYPAFLANLNARTKNVNAQTGNIAWSQAYQNRVLANEIAQREADRTTRYKLGLKGLYGGDLGWYNAEQNSALGWASQRTRDNYFDLANWKFMVGLPGQAFSTLFPKGY